MSLNKFNRLVQYALVPTSLVLIILASAFFYKQFFTPNPKESTPKQQIQSAQQEVLSKQIGTENLGIINRLKPSNICEDNPNEYIISIDCYGVKHEIFNQRLSQKKSFYKYSNMSLPDEKALRNNIINDLVNQALTEVFLVKQDQPITPSELEAYYNRVRKGMSEEEYLSKVSEMYGATKDEHLRTIIFDLEKERVQQITGQPFTSWLNTAKANYHINIFR